MGLHAGCISLKPTPEGISDRQDVFALYKITLLAFIDRAFGWDEARQRALFTTSYAAKDCYSIVLGNTPVGFLVLKTWLTTSTSRSCFYSLNFNDEVSVAM